MSWLVDVAPTRVGAFYQFVRAVVSILVALIVGVGATAGANAHGIALSLIFVQIAVASYCFCTSAAGDRLEGSVSGIELAAGAFNILLLYLSHQASQAATTDSLPNPSNASTAAIATAIASTTASNATADTTSATTIMGVGSFQLGTPLQDTALVFALTSCLF